jgi:hypothetical protein
LTGLVDFHHFELLEFEFSDFKYLQSLHLQMSEHFIYLEEAVLQMTRLNLQEVLKHVFMIAG